MQNLALVVIDVQVGLDTPTLGIRNNPDAESNMALLLAQWREKSLPVVHIKHNSTEPHSSLSPNMPGNAIQGFARPHADERLFEKSVNSAFIGTDLEGYLKNNGIQNIVVIGLTTDHCVSTSVRMAANLGFTVWLIADATATFDRTSYDGAYFSAQQLHDAQLTSLHGEFCSVMTTQEALSRMA